jgi:hypothetical protein
VEFGRVEQTPLTWRTAYCRNRSSSRALISLMGFMRLPPTPMKDFFNFSMIGLVAMRQDKRKCKYFKKGTKHSKLHLKFIFH